MNRETAGLTPNRLLSSERQRSECLWVKNWKCIASQSRLEFTGAWTKDAQLLAWYISIATQSLYPRVPIFLS